MPSEKFSLKWNDFASYVSNSFSRLRQETRLYDVTLVSNDHQQVSAHKLVLSACSEVFSTIFHSNNSSNMMLYLDSVDAKELNVMLDYIYQGEVQVQQEHLNRFMEIATKFKLSGLLTSETEWKEEEAREINPETIKPQDIHFEIVSEDKKENKPRYEKEISVANIAKNDKKFAELIEVEEDGIYRCAVCEKKIWNKKDMKRHLETHLSKLSYSCSECGKDFNSSNALRQHVIKNHF